jgi:hypothetical protein
MQRFKASLKRQSPELAGDQKSDKTGSKHVECPAAAWVMLKWLTLLVSFRIRSQWGLATNRLEQRWGPAHEEEVQLSYRAWY